MKYRIKLPNYFTITLAVSIVAYIFLANTSRNWADDYYTRLGNAFLAGQTYLQIQPPEALLALPNPYDGFNRNRKIGTAEDASRFNQKLGFMWDASLYDAKYYLYFGPAPILMPWLPVKWLLHYSLPDSKLVIIYALFGSSSLLLLLHMMFSKMRPTAAAPPNRLILWLIAALPLYFGTAVTLLLKRPMFYEASIAGAYCYSAMGITLLWVAYMEKPKKPPVWKLLASLCFGLAAGCRLFHGANVIILLMAWLSVCQHQSLKSLCKEAVVLFAPWLFVIASIGAYNYLRFDSILETGVTYQLGFSDNRQQGSMFGSLQHLLFNLNTYLLTPLPTDNLWPWATAFGRADTDKAFGVLANNIFIIWCLCAAPFMRIKLKENSFFFSFMLGVIVYGTMCLTLVMVYNWQNGRYIVDFSPWLMLCASLCFMHLAQTQKTLGRQRAIIALGALMSTWTVYTGFFAFSCVKC